MAKNLYRLYIDESGDHTYGKKKTSTFKIKHKNGFIEVPFDDYHDLDDDNKRYLSLTGCIIKRDFYENTFCESINNLKKAHFPYDPDNPVILHREDILNKRKAFSILKDPKKEGAFNGDLLNFINKMDYKLITVVIDKKVHIERYSSQAYHPYHYCLAAMLERYCGLLAFSNANGDVLAESRGKKEDGLLKEAYQLLYHKGTSFRPKNFFQQTLTSKEIKLKKKWHNISGLQLADILAHPLKKHILERHNRIPSQNNFGTVVANIAMVKFNRHAYNGNIDGYGRVFLK